MFIDFEEIIFLATGVCTVCRVFLAKENLTNSQFSSIDELNVDECLDSSKSYTCSVTVWQIKYWRYQKFVKFVKFSLSSKIPGVRYVTVHMHGG